MSTFADINTAKREIRFLRLERTHLRRRFGQLESETASVIERYGKLIEEERAITMRLSNTTVNVMFMYTEKAQIADAAMFAAFVHELRAELVRRIGGGG